MASGFRATSGCGAALWSPRGASEHSALLWQRTSVKSRLFAFTASCERSTSVARSSRQLCLFVYYLHGGAARVHGFAHKKKKEREKKKERKRRNVLKFGTTSLKVQDCHFSFDTGSSRTHTHSHILGINQSTVSTVQIIIQMTVISIHWHSVKSNSNTNKSNEEP